MPPESGHGVVAERRGDVVVGVLDRESHEGLVEGGTATEVTGDECRFAATGDVPWVEVRVNKPGAIRGARDVGVWIRRERNGSEA